MKPKVFYGIKIFTAIVIGFIAFLWTCYYLSHPYNNLNTIFNRIFVWTGIVLLFILVCGCLTVFYKYFIRKKIVRKLITLLIIILGLSFIAILQIIRMQWGMVNTTLSTLLVLFICVLLIISSTSSLMIYPLKRLQDSIKKLDGLVWNDYLNIYTGDEIEEISNCFNIMKDNLKGRFNKIKKMQRVYSCFFPNEIISYIDKDSSIVDMKRKKCKSNVMGVLMTNICSYYSYSKNMTDEERFIFIDEYINKVGPAIYKEGGFISKFTGYGVMALFPSQKVQNLLEAALEIQRSIRKYNNEGVKSGIESYSIGIGIHISKSVLLGIVGFESEEADVNRLEVAVMDEEVVMTEAMQNAAKNLGASILASEVVINNLESSYKYQYRYLGVVLFQNINQNIEVYDVYQEDDDELRNGKEKTKKKFEEGVLLYQEQQFKRAKDIFIDIIRINDRDMAAKMYYFLCDEYKNMDKLPQNWDKQITL